MVLTIAELKTKLGITVITEDTLLTLILEQAKDAVTKHYYGTADVPEDYTFPEKFSYVALDIAIYLYNKQGVEGQSIHKEQGVDREYGSSDIPPEMFRTIIRKVKTLTV